MRISAVIPTYNRPAQTVEAVESVLAQTRMPNEVIVVNDGSTDDTADALKQFGDTITVITQDNRGVAAARNTGIANASCEWLAFLDSDDLWLPRKLERQTEMLKQNPDIRVIYTDEKWVMNGKHKNQGKRHQKHSGMIYDECLPLCVISPSSVMIHRSMFDDVGLFDEDLPPCEDYDMWLRICAKYPVLCVPDKLIVKQAGRWDQLSKQHSMDRQRIRALRKIMDSGILTDDQAETTSTALREKVRVYALGCRKHGKEQEAAWAEDMY